MAQDWDRRLIARTLEVAQHVGGFSARALRAALDSSPWWGAARVEDTYQLGLLPAAQHGVAAPSGTLRHQA
jgi:hypothetical protein